MDTKAKLAKLNGLSVNDVRNLPHPIDLMNWYDAGWYKIDTARQVFVLTDKAPQ
jgi:hypothetical protein